MKLQYVAPPEGHFKDWEGCKANDFNPTPRQQVVMDAVGIALGEGLFYTAAVLARVTEIFGVGPEVTKPGSDRVEGGNFGMDLYLARCAIDAKKKFKELSAIAKELNLKVGDAIGTIINSDSKQTTGVYVLSAGESGLLFEVSGKRGSCTVMCKMDARAVKNSIQLAFERSRRKDGYAGFVASRNLAAKGSMKTGEEQSAALF